MRISIYCKTGTVLQYLHFMIRYNYVTKVVKLHKALRFASHFKWSPGS